MLTHQAMAWWSKSKPTIDASEKRTLGRGIFRRCDACGRTLKAEEFTTNYEVCPVCNHHYPLSGEAWISLILDPGSWRELDQNLLPEDPLQFRDSKRYAERTKAASRKAGVPEAFLSGMGMIQGRNVHLGTFLFRYMGGSMGSVVGEKIARLFERGAQRKEPVIILTASGGARMQEGILSLMQMAKTVSCLGRLQDAGAPFISILLNPTTGGVAASFALLGDVNIAEPNALIGFAGPRVIESTIRQTLPEGFQRAEFLLEHGFIDMIAKRQEIRAVVSRVLMHLSDV